MMKSTFLASVNPVWGYFSSNSRITACPSLESTYRIEDLGVWTFEKAEHPKGASLALPRREARSARRPIRRRRHRKERIKSLLQQMGCIGEEELESLSVSPGFPKDVYPLRAEGLDRLLERDAWVRVLLRGYR